MPVFKGSQNFYDYDVTDILGYNIKSFLEYGLLEIGAYTNVTLTSANSGYALLQRTHDDRFGGAGRVYEGYGPSWVWETDVIPPSGKAAPFQASGIYVNNTFYPTVSTSGQYSHYIDYRNGRVVFDSSVSANTVVKCEYSFRDIDVFLQDSPQWKTIRSSYLPYLQEFNRISEVQPSGMASILKDRRVWLPCVAITMDDMTFDRGIQLGGGDIYDYEVRYHVFSDSSFANKRLSDIINNQAQKTLKVFNINNHTFPYRFNGSLASGALSYKQLSSDTNPSFWTHAYINDGGGGPRNSMTDIYRAELNHSISVYRHLSTY